MTGIKAILLDVNGTLYSTKEALEPVFVDLGLDPSLVELFWESTLKDAFATQMAGHFQPLREFASHHLYKLMHKAGDPMPNVSEAVDKVMTALTAAEPFADVGSGLKALHAKGYEINALTNGSAALAKAVITRSGFPERKLGALMDINMACAWKPAAASYQWAVEKLGLQPYEVLMVASHAWDVFAAMREGLQGAYVQRDDIEHWPGYIKITPRYSVRSLEELAEKLPELED